MESKLGSDTWEKATGPGYQYENRQGKKEVVEDVEKKERGRQIKRLNCIEGHILLKGIHKNTAMLTFLQQRVTQNALPVNYLFVLKPNQFDWYYYPYYFTKNQIDIQRFQVARM